jgi:hypothetical protein
MSPSLNATNGLTFLRVSVKLRARAHSSVWQSHRLITGRSQVRILLGPKRPPVDGGLILLCIGCTKCFKLDILPAGC